MAIIDLTEVAADSPTERRVTVLVDRCAGCQECVIRCPVGALSMEPLTWTAQADSASCVGCRQCERTCPFSAIEVEGPLAVAARHDPETRHLVRLRGSLEETRVGFESWEEAIAEATRCLDCPDPTCMRGCPAHNDIPQFVAAIRDRDLARAHGILQRTTVMPDICSRVCNQAAQCEGSCTWSLAGGEPVAVGRLERFVADQMAVPPIRVAGDGREPLSVGIVGSGPAGIGAAHDLVEAGAHVTVYERDSRPGGLLIWGMPDFTLPDDVASRPWRDLVAAGVDLRTSTPVAPDALDTLLEIHDAVIVAHGAGEPIRLNVAGSNLDGIGDATHFLKGAKAALEPGGDPEGYVTSLGLSALSGRVLVLGAGNTAMDVARMARRLGLEATCVDWLDERFSLARPDELAEARAEGVEVRFRRTLTRLEGAGRVARAVLAHTTQARREQTPQVSDTDFDELDVDLVVMAMGYRLEAAFREKLPATPVLKRHRGFAPGRWTASGILAGPASSFCYANPVGTLALDREVGLWSSAQPQRPRLWAAGDGLTGPGTVVEAMAQGRRAARSILDARPARPDRAADFRAGSAPRILIAVASSGGSTSALGEVVADRLGAAGALVTSRPVEKVTPLDVAEADAIVLGTWVEGMIVAGVRPAKAMRDFVESLPWLGGRPVVTFCTYAISPRTALEQLTEMARAKGGTVIASESFAPSEHGVETRIRPSKVEAFVNRISARVIERKVPVAS